MKYKDTLQLFDELIASGTPEPQARIQAQQLGYVGSEMNSITNILVKIENDLRWMRLVGGAMTLAFLSNGLAAWFR